MQAQLLKPAAYARHRNVSRQAVSKAVKDGRISLINGCIDPAVADIQWANNTDAAQSQRAAGQREQSGVSPDASSWRERREAAEAQLVEQKLYEQCGLLVRVDDVKRATAELVAKATQKLAQLGPRLAPALAAESDVAKVREMIEQEVTAIREAIAGGD
jgi:hypothetical protein